MKAVTSILVALLSLVKCAFAKKFLYFAYGSNLLATRIHINNPSAVFVGAARLADHRLDFIKTSAYWRGAAATVVEESGREVWGALWQLDVSHLATLDEQEGVHLNWYFAKNVEVMSKDERVFVARTYEQTVNPPRLIGKEVIPVERRPSITYLMVIIKGAIECNLPEHYIRYLYQIPHNGRIASPEILEQVERDIQSLSLEDIILPTRVYP